MAAQGKGQSGTVDRRKADYHSAVSLPELSQKWHEDKLPENVDTFGDKTVFKKTENHLSKLAEELFGSPVDTDKLLVAALILLLLKEGADPKLILALGYIFM